jgi:cellulose biosynthesis protein BcsQ
MTQQTWRTSLRELIKEKFVHTSQEWFDIFLSTASNLDLTIVSHQFARLSFAQRREQVQELLSQLNVSLETGMFSLYTPQEAESLDLAPAALLEEQPIYTWHDLATLAANIDVKPIQVPRQTRIPHTIAFYSFKGGVGRTTALTHVAWILAQRGRKVVVVDLDLEAPGLSSAFDLSPGLKHGIVDYFYERAYIPRDVEPTISITEIFGEVRISEAPGRLFIVPAGELNLDYISKVDDLRTTAVTQTGEDLWSTFFNEINQQVQPDIILVDSRTGINQWGAFSLLRAADKAIVFLYPNHQNRQGIDLLLEALAGKISVQLIFSPVPFGDAGRQIVREHWLALQERLEKLIIPDKNLPEEDDLGLSEPIIIQYLAELALAPRFPVLSLASHYMNIANIIDDDTTATSLEEVLSDIQQRWHILESLQFPEVDAANPHHNLRELFQRTNDFDKFLDGGTCLIRGRKGTGKTALYTLSLKHKADALALSRGRLDNITLLSGHGSFQETRPTQSEFRFLDQEIKAHHGSWEDFWRSYMLLRLYQEDLLRKSIKDARFQSIGKLLTSLPKERSVWQFGHTKTLAQISTSAELSLIAKDWLASINEQLHKTKQTLWLLYDDLDVDLESNLREEALKGLFQLIQASDASHLTAIRYKIFLREDIWSRLTFDNKSHFNGRDITLQWTARDFLRLALRQAMQSVEFSELVNRFAPVGTIDQATDEAVEKALKLLWGNRRDPNSQSKYVSRWVYDRLTDASKTTFPRSLNILLKEARAYELETSKGKTGLPAERLLQLKSLNEGLIRASAYRCDELREEYPDLRPFFDSLVGLTIVASRDELHRLWQKTIQQTLPEFKEFRKFTDFLISIGLIGIAEIREKEQGYRFAEIYTHGFRLYRGTRKY